MRTCKACNEVKELVHFRIRHRRGRPYQEWTCLSCRNSQSIEWQKNNPTKVAIMRHKTKIKQKYGLTFQEYQEMLSAQDGACKICDMVPQRRRLDVDHCHQTGAVRGLLCEACNKAIGLFEDSPELLRKAAQYLTEYRSSES